jgi:EAL domain-containing protein (putative c-di-GMP-specific phosphodiesterase class I)
MVAQPSLSAAWVPADTVSADPQGPADLSVQRPASGEIDSDALHMAIGDGSLELMYQPEVDLRSGELVAMEGLLRWRHPSLGLVTPHGFLPLAHRSGLMETIDTWVLAAAATQAASWLRLPGPLRTVWLNVSMAQLTDERFIKRFSYAMNTCDLPKGALGLEISEQTLLRLGDRAYPLLSQLRARGASLVADDYNSHYGDLPAVPLDGLKLSQRFFRFAGDVAPYGTAQKLIDRVHDRGMYVVAEGVETFRENTRLVSLGCDRAHGYLYSAPLPAKQAGWMLKNRMVCRPVETAPAEGSV